MVKGLATVIYAAPDLAKAKAWYTSAFGQAPYFDQPFYVGFTIGGFDPPALERMKQLRLLPSYSKSAFEDLFSGAHKGARYELYEGCLQQRTTDSKGRTRYTTVFRGQLMRMHFPRDFLGVTIVRRDMGLFFVCRCQVRRRLARLL